MYAFCGANVCVSLHLLNKQYHSYLTKQTNPQRRRVIAEWIKSSSYFVFATLFFFVVIIYISSSIYCRSLAIYWQTKSLLFCFLLLHELFSCVIVLNYTKYVFLHKYNYKYIYSCTSMNRKVVQNLSNALF